jgi:PAS domain S-box-containing protein
MQSDSGNSARGPDPGCALATALNGTEPHLPDEWLRIAIDQIAGVAVLSFDSQMRFVAAAGGALARHGYQPQDIIGRTPRELGARWAALEHRCGQALAGARNGREPFVDFSPDGKTTYAALISPVRDQRERISGGVVAMRNITAQREVEAALQRAQSDCGAIVEQSADMLSRHDERGFYTYVSPACVTIYGRKPNEMIGRHPLEFAHPDDVDGARALIEKALVGSEDFAVEHRVLRPDGGYVWVHAAVRLYLDESGRRLGIGATRDISAQRAVEDTLADAERQARALIEFSGDMHNRTDADGQLAYVSPNCEEVTGYRLEQLRGHSPHEFIHPEDRERYDATTSEACEHGAAEIEYRFRRPDGRYMWLHVLLRARYDEQGQLVEIVRTVRDITTRKHAEIALAQERRLLNVFLETTPDQVYFKDLHGRFLRISGTLAARVGFKDPEYAIGKSDFDAFSDEHAGQALEDERQIIATGEPIIGFEE